MAHSHAADAHHDDHAHGGTIKAYLMVFAALCVFTVVSFVVNSMVRGGSLTATAGFGIILAVAIVKALLVCAIFMHLKWDWSKLYFLIVPTFVLAPFLCFALMPDIVLYWKNLNRNDVPTKPSTIKAH